MSDRRVQEVGAAVSEHLAEIAEMFKDGAKLTFLARFPDWPDGSRDMLVTNDSLDGIVDAVRIRQASESTQ